MNKTTCADFSVLFFYQKKSQLMATMSTFGSTLLLELGFEA